MTFKIEGLDQLQRQFDELAHALGNLDGDLTTVTFDPNDPSSIEAAVSQMEQAIDAKTSAYQGNAMLHGVIAEMKEKYRQPVGWVSAEGA